MAVLQQLKGGMKARRPTFYCQCAAILLCHILTSIATGEVTINVPVTVVSYSAVSPVDAWNAVDNDKGTAWDLPIEETTANFTGEFDQPYAVSEKDYD